MESMAFSIIWVSETATTYRERIGLVVGGVDGLLRHDLGYVFADGV